MSKIMRRKNQSAFAAFTRVGQIPEIFPAARIKGKLVSAIRQEMAPGIDILGIRYGTFQEALNDDDVLLEKYPNIWRTQQPNKFLQQEYTILPLNQDNKDNKWILFEVNCDSNVDIPKFLVPITPDIFNNGHVKDILQFAQDSFGLENNPKNISTKESEISLDMPLSEFFAQAKEHQMIYNTSLTPDAEEIIKKRANVIEEIHKTEQHYVEQLDKIIQFWTPEIKKRKLFSEVDYKMIFNDIPSIYNCHKIFLDDLEKLIGGYSTQVAGLFVSHASLFDVAVPYISSYQQINEVIMEKCQASNSTKKDLYDLSEQCGGLDLNTFLIAPVQRITQYQLFLRELLKCTPPSHPDSFLIKEAANAIDKILRKIEYESMNNAQMWRLKQLEKNLLNTFKIFIPTRRFVFQTPVKVKGHSDNKGTIYIFNDIILLTKEQTKGITVLFDSPADQFHYHIVNDIPLAIMVSAVLKPYNKSMLNPRKDYIVVFPNEETWKEFFKHIVLNQNEKTESYEYSLDWALMNTRFLPHVEANAGAANGAEFIFFGGNKGDKSGPTALLSAINQFSMEYKEINASTKGRCGHTLTLIGSRLFIVGGKNMKRFFKKILCYELKTNVWSQQLPNSTDDFEPRYGHTTSLVDNKLIIFGGRTQDGKILNTITIFDPFDNMFVTLKDLKNAPPPRYHHAAVVYGNSLIIHGGKTNGKKLLSDVWEFQIDKQVWTQKDPRGEPLIPRKCHAMYTINGTAIIVGGVTTGGDFAPTLQLDLESFISKKVVDTGNVPYALRKFAAFVDRSGKMYAYGGMERKSKQPCSSFYLLKPKDSWYKQMLEKKTKDDFAELSLERIFNTQKFKSQRFNFPRQSQSITHTLFSDIDTRSDADEEMVSQPIHPRRSRSPNARPRPRSTHSSQQFTKSFGHKKEKEISIPQPTTLPKPTDMEDLSIEAAEQSESTTNPSSNQSYSQQSEAPTPQPKPKQKKQYGIVLKSYKKKEKQKKEKKEPKILFPEREMNLEEEEVPEAVKEEQAALAQISIFQDPDMFPQNSKTQLPETQALKEEKESVAPSVPLADLLNNL